MVLQFRKYQNEYSGLNGHKNMHIRRIDLCRHTMQVGYKNKSSFLNTSLYKHLELFFMVMANVNYVDGELMLNDEYSKLDQSEKAGISYQLGQGLTKAVAEKYFNVPWVAHIKTMKNMNYNFIHGGTTKIIIDPNEHRGVEPDLIGFDKGGNAHLFESKGSSSREMQNNTKQKAINQVSNYVYFIDPSGCTQNFVTRNACLFNFTPVFHGLVIDPPIDGENQDSIGLLHCLYNYYYHFLDNREKQFETIEEFNREWSGYVFSFGGEKYFWGINSLYIDFLQEQLVNNSLFDNFFIFQNHNQSTMKVERILDFFNRQDYFNNMNDNDFVSIGKDGYILCNLNKI